MFKKLFLLAGLASLAAGLCLGQDLVEAAKKEKERREARRGEKTVVITNTSLADLKKKPAVPSQAGEAGPAVVQPGTALLRATTPVPGTFTAAPPAGPEPTSPGAGGQEQEKADYQDRFDKAKERRDLLELKLLSLRQQLTTFNSMESKEKVQRDFAETFQKFQQAQAEAAKAKEDLDRALGNSAGKSAAPAIK